MPQNKREQVEDEFRALTGESLEEYVRRERARGKSWRQVAVEVFGKLKYSSVSDMTIQRWYKDD